MDMTYLVNMVSYLVYSFSINRSPLAYVVMYVYVILIVRLANSINSNIRSGSISPFFLHHKVLQAFPFLIDYSVTIKVLTKSRMTIIDQGSSQLASPFNRLGLWARSMSSSFQARESNSGELISYKLSSSYHNVVFVSCLGLL